MATSDKNRKKTSSAKKRNGKSTAKKSTAVQNNNKVEKKTNSISVKSEIIFICFIVKKCKFAAEFAIRY